MNDRQHGMTYAAQGLRLPTRDGAVQRAISPEAWLRGEDLGVSAGLAEPYRRSTWVRAAIQKISGNISYVPVDVYPSDDGYMGIGKGARKKTYRRSRGVAKRATEEALDVPGLRAFMRQPMAGMGWNEFVESTIGWRKMLGEAFWLLPDDVLMPGFRLSRKPLQVIVARPHAMRPVIEDERVIGWVFRDGASKPWTLLPEQVIHLRKWNPYDAHRGLGEYDNCAVAAEGDYLAGVFARNLAANNGDTGPILVAKGGMPGDEQREQILAAIRSKRAAQQRGDFRPIFLTGDVAVEDPQIKSVDAAYIAGRIENRHEIFIAFGVPPSMADVKAAYSIGSASDFYQLILGACVPEGDVVCDGLARLIKVCWGLEVECFLDWDEHPVFQEVRKERLASADSLFGKGVPMSVIDEWLGLGLPDFPGKNVGYLPFGLVPVGSDMTAEDPAEDPAMQEPEEEDAVEAMMRALQAGCAHDQHQGGTECGCDVLHLDTKRDAKELAQWKELMLRRRETLAAYRSKFNQVLFKAREEVLAAIEGKAVLLTVGKAAAGDFIFDLLKFKQGLQAVMRQVGMSALQTAGEQLFKELAKNDPWKMPPPEALKFLVQRENKMAGVADEVFNQVKGSLEQGLNDGDTMNQLAQRVRGEFTNMSRVRALRVAMTETSAAYGTSRQAAMKAAGVEKKRWLTSGNSNVRAAHMAMNGAIVGLDENFTVIDPRTGEVDEVKHPGDPDGLPWNVINCHCVSVAEIDV